MLTCPTCDAKAETVGALAGHLATTHGLGSSEALIRAREVANGPKEEAPAMATGRKCGACGETGHRKDKCPKSAKPKRARVLRAATPNGQGAADARRLLAEKLAEELADKRAEVRVLETMLAKIGG